MIFQSYLCLQVSIPIHLNTHTNFCGLGQRASVAVAVAVALLTQLALPLHILPKMPTIGLNPANQKKWDTFEATLRHRWGLNVNTNPIMEHFRRPNAQVPLNIMSRLAGLASTFPVNGHWIMGEIVHRHGASPPIITEAELKRIAEAIKALPPASFATGQMRLSSSSSSPAPPPTPHTSLGRYGPPNKEKSLFIMQAISNSRLEASLRDIETEGPESMGKDPYYEERIYQAIRSHDEFVEGRGGEEGEEGA